ncbi:hypothetical protein DPMN_133447 [Dreissena polymorpha]|uniref:EGF-like domain-containing protein n=1 Tax=Dreissena polymorpha TaxID=45954 RepID=A0A9D4FUA2_DREPO|nr:hypothetical protein DPMN_133447 [Dreissena polymorpha]
MFAYVIRSSFIVAIAAASCVPNPCQNGGTCFSFPNHSEDFGCTCTTGWDGQFCTTPFRYVGCFKDTSARIMHVRLPYSNSNSPLECAARCHAYAYSGTQGVSRGQQQEMRRRLEDERLQQQGCGSVDS